MNISRRIVNSSNWSASREGNAITGIVLHTEVGTNQSSEVRFNDPTSQVSVHYGVELDGSIAQWVDEADTAYQAGNWQVNLTTIGIEHSDNGNPNDAVRTPQLYNASSDLVADICRRYNIPPDSNHIFLHKDVIDISHYPSGTACPDALDTVKIISMAVNKLQGVPMDAGTVTNLYLSGWQRQPTQEELNTWVGKPMQDFFYNGGKNQYEWLWQQIRQLQQQVSTHPTKLNPGIYQVV